MSTATIIADLPVQPLVDAHAHVFTQAMPLIDKPRHRPTYDFALAQYLAELDTHGIRHGVIAAASPWGDYNDYTMACVASTPRLRGTVILHPEKQYDLQAMDKAGIVGVRLPFIGLAELPDLGSAAWRAQLRRIADLGWHVHLHVEGRHIPALLPLLENSGPRIVIDHLGRPAPEEPKGSAGYRAIVAAVQRGRTWIKASCGYRMGPIADEHFTGFLEELGPQALFWASDCPFVGHEGQLNYTDTITWLAALVPDSEMRQLIFGANAYAFYFGAR
jgi:predicted TIM-barrel fold metal-dependent hydrolase